MGVVVVDVLEGNWNDRGIILRRVGGREDIADGEVVHYVKVIESFGNVESFL